MEPPRKPGGITATFTCTGWTGPGRRASTACWCATPATRWCCARLGSRPRPRLRGWTPRSAQLTFLARWPSRKATQQARDRIREITDRKRLLVPVQDIVAELNRFLRGWAGYFRYGNSARVLGQIRNYALRRVALLLSKTGKRRRSWDWGMRQVLRSPDHLGLISLDGAVIPPRPFRDWRTE